MCSVRSNSIFSFCLCKDGIIDTERLAAFESSRNFGGYKLHYDCRTPLDYAIIDNRELAVFGFSVNVYSGESGNIAESILKSVKSFDEVIDYEKKLGGKYVLFYADNSGCYCLGDATCSVPVYYTVGISSFVCCSSPKLISDSFGLKQDAILLKIRKSGRPNQAMPFDVTVYKEIKQLIPNHYLKVSNGKTFRFVNSSSKQTELTPEEAAKITEPMIRKIADYYSSQFKIRCPLTAGRDSRVVLSFLKNTPTYTVWQKRFESDDQDWVIPPKLAKLCSVQHERINHIEITDEDRHNADALFGKNSYPDDAYRLALTIGKYYSGEAIVEGDIIGQVGKCSLHRNIPSFLATAGYFRCKLHNYSGESKRLLDLWLDEIKESGEKINTFDLFSIENRLGRWAAQTHIIHNGLGQLYLNIFNSRSIIYTWTAVKRKERMGSEIHISLIKINAPELLSIPFESDKSSFVKLAKMNGITYYLASYVKYYIERRSFLAENQK